jgi:hypothetical protein
MDIFLGQPPGAMDKEIGQFTNAVNELLHINSIRTIFGYATTIYLNRKNSLIVHFRPIARLCPDWLFAPQAYKDYNRYLERLVSENFLPDKENHILKDGSALNLRQALILEKVDIKVGCLLILFYKC